MNIIDADTVALYDSLPRVVMGHRHVESGGGRWFVRTEVPWEPRHGDSYVLKGWDALRPPARSWVWVLMNPRMFWQERAAWQRLVACDKLAREAARMEARRLAGLDFKSRFAKAAR